MNGLPTEIFRRWGHSFEEDNAETIVFRPAEYEFPRARGRDGIEFKMDGTFIDWKIGRGDAKEGINGHWQIIDSFRVRISFDTAVRSPRILEILQCNKEILKVRWLPATA
jgi:hypothetical protein